MISRQTFAENLRNATDFAMAWAREHVVNILPEKVKYYIENEVILDRNLWSYEQEKFFDEFLSHEQLIDRLLRNGTVPRYINLNVHTIKDDVTIMTVEHADEYVDDQSELLYQEDGFPPFHALSPVLPPTFVEKAGETPKFDLFWKKKKVSNHIY